MSLVVDVTGKTEREMFGEVLMAVLEYVEASVTLCEWEDYQCFEAGHEVRRIHVYFNHAKEVGNG